MAVQGSAASLALSGGADDFATTKGLTGSFSVNDAVLSTEKISVGSSWKDASGHTRLVREHWSSVAMTQQRYLDVRLHVDGSAVRLFA